MLMCHTIEIVIKLLLQSLFRYCVAVQHSLDILDFNSISPTTVFEFSKLNTKSARLISDKQ